MTKKEAINNFTKETVNSLICCITEQHRDCKFDGLYNSQINCMKHCMEGALSLINTQNKRIEELEQALTDIENIIENKPQI